MSAALIALAILTLPAFILWLTRRYDWAQKLGPIVLCYGIGLILGNAGLLPTAVQTSTLPSLSEASVALALPMLLFTLDIRAWSKSAGTAMLSLVFSTTAVVAVSTMLFIGLGNQDVVQSSHLAAMSVGVYTGGTANLAAIKSGLGIPHELYILFHSMDTLIGAIYLMIMVSVAIPFFRRILIHKEPIPIHSRLQGSDEQQIQSPGFSFAPSQLKELLTVLALAIGVVAVSVLTADWLKAIFELDSAAAVTIMLLTSFGILLSFLRRIREMTLAYELGMYLILVFCVAVAGMADIGALAGFDIRVAVFIGGAVLGSLILHALLCKLGGVDSDTFMVTSVSAICSPPFVPMMAKALGNPSVILSGMTTGIIGFAIGNYLGISLALILQQFF